METTTLDRTFSLGGNKLPIIVYPDPILQTICEEVTVFDDKLKNFVRNMLTTMYHAPGIGLAAPQVGLGKRIFVLDTEYNRKVTESEKEGVQDTVELSGISPTVFINPVITDKTGEIQYEEGCLSLPETFEKIDRAEELEIEYLDIDGDKHKLHADGLLAICIQHENDHLNGITFINYLSNLKKTFYRNKLVKEKRRRGQ